MLDFCSKLLLLFLLKEFWDDFDFCRIFAEIFDKKSAQRCMIHHGMVTPRCILHSGDDFIFEYLLENSAKIEPVPVYL